MRLDLTVCLKDGGGTYRVVVYTERKCVEIDGRRPVSFDLAEKLAKTHSVWAEVWKAVQYHTALCPIVIDTN